MNRRHFLTRLSTGLVGACVAAHIPTGILPAKVRTAAALDYLRTEFNRVCKGKGAAHAPKVIYAGRALYEAAKAELTPIMRKSVFGGTLVNARYPESLMFKGATLLPCDELSGWQLAFEYGGPSATVVITNEESYYRS